MVRTRLNALSTPLRKAIVRTFRELKDDRETEVVMLTGAGRAFTAGLDLKELGGETGDASTAGEGVNDTDLEAALQRAGQAGDRRHRRVSPSPAASSWH
ncbi:MAG: enoyl-CoA hydratase-related protein [Gammaproteobacteria bacterium]|nr:enoyl-CoA hydratase-related protein [Gammaproteobacteria bacterium]